MLNLGGSGSVADSLAKQFWRTRTSRLLSGNYPEIESYNLRNPRAEPPVPHEVEIHRRRRRARCSNFRFTVPAFANDRIGQIQKATKIQVHHPNPHYDYR